MTLHILPIIDSINTNQKPFVPNLKYNSNRQLNGFFITNELQIIKKIGAGTYGLIYLVRDVKTEEQYAAKIILKEQMSLHQKDIEAYKKFIQEKVYYEFMNRTKGFQNLNLDSIREAGHLVPYLKEIAIHLKCHHHPNVVTIHKVFDFDAGIITLMDYYEQGDLFKSIVDEKIFSSSNPIMMKNCILQIINVISYLRLKNIYHCDMKPENIMVRYNPNYKRLNYKNIIDYNELSIGLIDFGLSMESAYICCNSCRGSSFYMSPERVVNYSKNEYIKSKIDLSTYPVNHEDELMYFPTIKGDIWSIGILLINITCSRNPWPNSSIVPNNNEVFQTYYSEDKSVLKRILPISSEFNSLLNKVFELDPNDRIDLVDLFNEIVHIDFFNDSMLTPPESPTL